MLLLLGCQESTEESSNRVATSAGARAVIDQTSAPSFSASTLSFVVKKDLGAQALGELLLATDSDLDFLTYSLTAPPAKGELSGCLGLNGASQVDLTCIYTPAPLEQGKDSFVYTALDGTGKSASVTVSVSIDVPLSPSLTNLDTSLALNQSVIENGGKQTLLELPSASVTGSEFITYTLTRFPTRGELSDCLGLSGTQDSDLICSYTPTTDYFGSDSFEYTSVSLESGLTVTQRIDLNILSTNSSPLTLVSAHTVSSVVKRNLGIQDLGDLSAIIGASDPDGDALRYRLKTAPSSGSLSFCLGLSGAVGYPDLQCSYTPTTDFKGTDSFVIEVADINGATKDVTISVEVYNNVPSPDTLTVTLTEGASGGPITFTITDADEATLGATEITSIAGTSPLNGNGHFDGRLSQGRLSNCFGLEGAASGLVAGTFNKTQVVCTYTPNSEDLSGTAVDTFQYTATDKSGEVSSSGVVTVDITGVPDNPVFADQTVEVWENGGLQVFTITAATDVDPGDVLTYSLVSGADASNGTLNSGSPSTLSCVNGDTDLTCDYTPNTDFTGSDVITVRAYGTTDGLTDDASISINVKSTNGAPKFPADNMVQTGGTLLENNTGSRALVALPSTLLGATDPDSNDTLTYSIVGMAGDGTLPTGSRISGCVGLGGTANDDLSCLYVGPNGVFGDKSDNFLLKATDNEGAFDTLLVYVDLISTNAAPTGTNGSLTMTESPQVASFSVAQGTDADNDDSTLKYIIDTLPTRGTLTGCLGLPGFAEERTGCQFALATSDFTDSSQDIVTGTSYDTFTYKIADDMWVPGSTNGLSDAITYTIDVSAVDSNPTLTPSSNFPATITMAENDTLLGLELTLDEGGRPDEDAEALEMRVTSTSSNAALLPDTDSNIKFFYGTSRSSAAQLNSGSNPSVYQGLGDAANNASSLGKVYIDVIPAADNTGVVTLTVEARQTVATTQTVSSSFVINVHSYTVAYATNPANTTGWTKVVSRGAKAQTGTAVTVLDSETPLVKLGWGPFEVSTTDTSITPTVEGYRVYRHTAATGFDYSSPVGVITSANTREFTDTTIPANTSRNTAVGYFYEVRPYFGTYYGIPQTASTQTFKTLRVLVPPVNKVLVHRWAANRHTCVNILGKNPDPSNSYRCPYSGPGSTRDSGVAYYDIGVDLMVDRYEIGCRYSETNVCTPGDGASGATGNCIGNGAPTTQTAAAGSIYYDKGSGTCYVRTAGGDWKSIKELTDDAHPGDKTAHVNATLDGFVASTNVYGNSANLPPLNQVTQLEAANYCADSDFDMEYPGGTTFTQRLPTRKEWLAMARFDTTNTFLNSDTKVQAVEVPAAGGFDYNNSVTTKYACNTIYGGARDGSITFSESVDLTSDLYPSTGVEAQSPLVFRTGSYATSNCTSLFGIQDLIGNVSEWVSDQYTCTNDCAPTSPVADYVMGDDGATTYSMDGNSGPDSTGLTSFYIHEKTASTTEFFLPMGLPVTNNLADSVSTDYVELNGTVSQVRGDRIVLDQAAIDNFASYSDVTGVIVGGDSTSGIDTGTTRKSDPGVYYMELPLSPYIDTNKNLGFRCVAPITNTLPY